jgi:plasmid replication initiation protein
MTNNTFDRLQDVRSFRDDGELMAYPWFSLQKQARTEPIEFVKKHDNGAETYIRVKGTRDGIATIWDKDVLIYAQTIIVERQNRMLPVDRVVTFKVHDFLKTTQRGTSKSDYDAFRKALKRLHGTVIETNITSGGVIEDCGFGWIESYRFRRRETAGGLTMASVEITLAEWLFRALVTDRRMLAITPAYFGLTGGVERRLYEIGRKHVGRSDYWYIGLDNLHQRMGVLAPLPKFKFMLKQIERAQPLPDFLVRLEDEPERLRAHGERPDTTVGPQPRNRRALVHFERRPG